MNREIKFRVWYKYKYNNGEMIYIDDWYWYEENRINSFSDFKSEGYTLMQYTGLKDKNGKEIYEGDILKVKFPDMDKLKKETSKVLYPVILEDFKDGYLIAEVIADFSEGWLSQFTYYLNGYIPFQKLKFLTSQDNVTVIGNIYENPELLQSGT